MSQAAEINPRLALQPITGLAAWKGGEIADDPAWVHRFSAPQGFAKADT